MAAHNAATPLPSKADRRRERELYSYYKPYNSETADAEGDGLTLPLPSSGTPASPDATLTALSQLMAFQLNTKRAFIGVFDANRFYALSESTKSLDLTNTAECKIEGDDLFLGRTSYNKSESLCENTIKLHDKLDEPCFVVNDLSKDERFYKRPMVVEPPYFRFYAGAPLYTKKGIAIGSVCVIDDKPRDGLSKKEEALLVHMASIVMEHIELKQQALARSKAARMADGLNAFVQGKDSMPKEPVDNMGAESDFRPGHARDDVSAGESHSASQDSDTETPIPGVKNDEAGLHHSFCRAARILEQSLELEDVGGIVFFDTALGAQNGTEDPQADGDTTPTSPSTQFHYDGKSKLTQKAAGILGKSMSGHSIEAIPEDGKVPTFRPISEADLQQLVKKHPSGKLWVFEDDAAVISSSEDDSRSPRENLGKEGVESRSGQRKLRELKMLHYCFPGARSLVFCPLWDSATSSYFSGCFAFTTASTRYFSRDVELSYVKAFSNCIMAEVSRLIALASDQQKGGFISSISHELRSPLHGVLASAEFLSETKLDAFQITFVDVVESCGRTLLDTINQLLDWTKVNAFEKTWRKAQKHRANSMRNISAVASEKAMARMPAVLSIYAPTDVAAIAEEVVEGVFAGQLYSQYSVDNSLLGGNSAGPTTDAVDLIIDIAHGDYMFITQPGAIRRVIMNCVGNALKYTTKGRVTVSLRLQNLANPSPEEARTGTRLLTIAIKDTGKGISNSYLKTRLFTPFAQENHLSPGAGLGLSIVRSIVTMLGGSIAIQSQVGRGTEVIVGIPLARTEVNVTLLSTPDSGRSSDRDPSTSIKGMLSPLLSGTIALFGFDGSEESTQVLTRQILTEYVTRWYGFGCISNWPSSQSNETGADVVPSVIIVDEVNQDQLSKLDLPPLAKLLVLRNSISGRAHRESTRLETEYLSKPFGPYRLAKAIKACLQANTNGDADTTSNNREFRDVKEVEIKGNKEEFRSEASPAFAHSGSVNARMAFSPTPMASDSIDRSFPFPRQGELDNVPVKEHTKSESVNEGISTGLALTRAGRLEVTKKSQDLAPSEDAAIFNAARAVQQPPSNTIAEPSILIVDDNAINLMLLHTFMKKRKYKKVDRAEDGLKAVQAAEKRKYDIIFMDISMPKLNGFEATRKIRDMERKDRIQHEQSENVTSQEYAPAFVIALTGLASARDQEEAFVSGIDLFLTKPVSFKEVGNLLDNWEENSSNG